MLVIACSFALFFAVGWFYIYPLLFEDYQVRFSTLLCSRCSRASGCAPSRRFLAARLPLTHGYLLSPLSSRSILSPSLPRQTENRHVQVLFCGILALSSSMFQLIIFEITGVLHPRSRWVRTARQDGVWVARAARRADLRC